MAYLSPQIEALAKKKATKSLIEKHNSFEILQDYGNEASRIEEQKNINLSTS